VDDLGTITKERQEMKIVAIYERKDGSHQVITGSLITIHPTTYHRTIIFYEEGTANMPVNPDGRYNFGNHSWRTRTDLGKKVSFESLGDELQERIVEEVWG
jgi:hypothetical protein